MDIVQKPNKSGQILDQCWKIFFAIFTKLIPRRIFCIANILVLMVSNFLRSMDTANTFVPEHQCRIGSVHIATSTVAHGVP